MWSPSADSFSDPGSIPGTSTIFRMVSDSYNHFEFILVIFII